MSPQAAAQISYPINKKLNKEIVGEKHIRKRGYMLNRIPERNAMAVAEKVKEELTDSDSILAIAKKLTDVYPSFDESLFFSQLSQDLESGRFNPRQKREIAEGKKGFFPYWGDTWFSFLKEKK